MAAYTHTLHAGMLRVFQHQGSRGDGRIPTHPACTQGCGGSSSTQARVGMAAYTHTLLARRDAEGLPAPRLTWGWPHTHTPCLHAGMRRVFQHPGSRGDGRTVACRYLCGSCAARPVARRTCSGTASCCLRNLTLPPRTWGSRPPGVREAWAENRQFGFCDNLYISCSLGEVCWYSSLILTITPGSRH